MRNGRLTRNGGKIDAYLSGEISGQGYLEDWRDGQPDNYFTYDLELQRSLEFLWGTDLYKKHAKRLVKYGEDLASIVADAVDETSQDPNLPRLERFDSIGHRTEDVVYHPSHHVAGKAIFESGIISELSTPGNNLLCLTLFYLSSQNGEAGHNCSIACTAGLVKILQNVAGLNLQERYLPRLLNTAYERLYQGAQFLTELQGGSDVGANSLEAKQLDPEEGTWLLRGEKWFCSNVTADLALITARVPGQGEGTRGLGLFLMPRYLDDGIPNNVTIKRLKDKLGTRSLATAELEFQDALAYNVGPTSHGFKNVMIYVINTSRIYNGVAVSGCARRAYVTAKTFAEHRRAFGQQIIRFPLVQASLARMHAASSAIRAGSLHLISLLDKVELGESNQQAQDFLRMAINLNKYRSSVLSSEVISQGIEILGGNGAIETFSILPRLFRDSVVFENWEGTHNVLLAQVQRDIRRYDISQAFFEATRRMLQGIREDGLSNPALEQLELIEGELEEVLGMDVLTGAIYFRQLMDRLTDLYYTACLASEGEWEKLEKKDRTKLHLAKLFFNERVLKLEPKDIPYYDNQVSRLC